MQLFVTLLAAMVVRVILLTLSAVGIWLTWNHGVVAMFESLPHMSFGQSWLNTVFLYFVGDVLRGTIAIKLNQ